ncbi:hypothetical protein D3C85_1681330 [compost metagenome]
MDRDGTPAASQASATGLTVSAVEIDSTKSTLSVLISSLVMAAARAGLLWVSLAMNSIFIVLPPT